MRIGIGFPVVLAVLVWGCLGTSLVQDSRKGSAAAPEGDLDTTARVLPVTARVAVGGKTVELEVARTPEQIASGLMFRKVLPADRGMLFIYEPAQIARFWMRHVFIPLDMIFLREGEIIHIAHSVPPCRGEMCPLYGPDSPVDQVIELRGGRARELGLAVGDPVRPEFPD